MCNDDRGIDIIAEADIGTRNYAVNANAIVYYSSYGFEHYIEDCPEYNWIKQ